MASMECVYNHGSHPPILFITSLKYQQGEGRGGRFNRQRSRPYGPRPLSPHPAPQEAE